MHLIFSVVLKQIISDIKRRRHFYIACLILCVTFAFSRLPFFIWMPIPIISPDTFDYYSVVREMMNGTFKGFGISPPGLSIFFLVMEFICTKTFYILIIQNLISFSVCIFFISVISKFYKKLAIPVAIALSIYMMDSYSLRFDFSFLTESLYRNSLIGVAGLMILILNSQKKIYWIIFSVFLIFPPLFRSNGLYIYFLLLFILIFLLVNKFSLKHYLLLFFPIVILNIGWSAFNYSTENRFFPGNPGRLNSVIHKIYSDNSKPVAKSATLESIKSKATLFVEFSTYVSHDRPQFYYTILVDAYKQFYVSDIIHDTAYKRSDWTLPVDTPLRKLTLKEFYTEPNKYAGVISDFEQASSHSLWLKTFNVYYKVHSFLFNNFIWILLFIAIYFISLLQLIRSRFKNKNAFLLFCLVNIHFLAILSLTFFGWFQERYIQVSEFVVYLTIALSPLLFNKIKTPIVPNAEQ